MKLSIVIPVYRSEAILESLYERLIKSLEQLQLEFEIIFVDDCGGDQSWQIIQQLSQQDSRVKGFKLSRNYGQHNALLCGINQASGELIMTMDDDLQHPPEAIQSLIDEINQGYDVVYGSPIKEKHSFFRNIASKATKLVLKKAMGVDIASKVSALRLFRSHTKQAFKHFRGANVNIDVLLTWGTDKYSFVEVDYAERQHGESGYSIWQLLTHAFNMVTGFSTLPLKLASLIGLVFSLFGFVLMAYALLNYFIRGGGVPGFTFLASTIAIFSGVQLFTIGIIGEYLSRIYSRSMEQPSFVVKDQTQSQAQTHAQAADSLKS